MNQYILPHNLAGERQRLGLMSELLDPLHRSHIEQLGLQAGWRCLHTALYNGGSPWAAYWLETLKELRPRLIESGYITEILMSEFNNLYSDPRFWTSAITFIAAWGRKPAEIAA